MICKLVNFNKNKILNYIGIHVRYVSKQNAILNVTYYSNNSIRPTIIKNFNPLVTLFEKIFSQLIRISIVKLRNYLNIVFAFNYILDENSVRNVKVIVDLLLL